MVKIKKIKAASLVEVIVANIIILIIFGMSMTVYLNVTRTSAALPKTQTRLFLQDYAIKTRKEKRFIDEQFEWGEYKIDRKVSFYQNNRNLIQITYSSYDHSDKLISERNELVYAGQED